MGENGSDAEKIYVRLSFTNGGGGSLSFFYSSVLTLELFIAMDDEFVAAEPPQLGF